jgi:hypothetical protein
MPDSKGGFSGRREDGRTAEESENGGSCAGTEYRYVVILYFELIKDI